MSVWHTCETTHCRAGWVIQLAGEAGFSLEKETDTAWAALQIYKASSTIEVHLHNFYQTNDEAMADIQRCAAEESAQMTA
jgi:hypothetical protein